jgi:hypothetical protein
MVDVKLVENAFRDVLKSIPWEQYRYNWKLVKSTMEEQRCTRMKGGYDDDSEAPVEEEYQAPNITFTDSDHQQLALEFKKICKQQFLLDREKAKMEYQTTVLYLRLKQPQPGHDDSDDDDSDWNHDQCKAIKSSLKPILKKHGIGLDYEELSDTDSQWIFNEK